MAKQSPKFRIMCPFSLLVVFAAILVFGWASVVPTSARTELLSGVSAPDRTNEGSLGTWSLVTSPVTDWIFSVSMTSASNGWAVGDSGTILHWNGNIWSEENSPTNLPLYDVKMISATDGWAVGQAGTKLHWDGSTWSDVSCEHINCFDLYSIDFTSANDVWVVGVSSILHWDGNTWSQSAPLSLRTFRSVAAISPDNAWIVGRAGSSYPYFMIQARWDGSTWTESSTNNGGYGLNAVDMVSSSEGWAVGNHYINHYTGSWEYGYYDSFPIFTSIEMLSLNDGWIVGGTNSTLSLSQGLIWHWDGSTWNVINNPDSKRLSKVDMLSANEGWAVGYEGIILHYMNYTKVYLPLVRR